MPINEWTTLWEPWVGTPKPFSLWYDITFYAGPVLDPLNPARYDVTILDGYWRTIAGHPSGDAPPVLDPGHEEIPGVVIPPPETQPQPEVSPQYAPHELPVFAPQPAPRPLPWRMIPYRIPNPFYPPFEQTERGPVPVPSPNKPGKTIVVTPPATPARPRPGAPGRDDPILEQPPEPQVVARPPRTNDAKAPFPRRPDRRTKERKLMFRAGPMGQLVKVTLEGLSEVADFITAMWEALPKKYQVPVYADGRWRRKLPQEMLRDLYDNFDQIDWQKAGENWAWNEIQDEAFGRIGNAIKGTYGDNPFYDRKVGLQSGPWDNAPRPKLTYR